MERQEPVDMVLLVQLDLAQSAVPGGGAQWAHEEEGKKKTISNTDESSVLCAFTQLVTKVNCSSEAVETTTNLAKKKQLWQATTSIMFGKVERSAKKKKQNTCIGK